MADDRDRSRLDEAGKRLPAGKREALVREFDDLAERH